MKARDASSKSLRLRHTPGSRCDWSPDGRLIAFDWARELGPGDIRVVHPDGTGEGRVTDDPIVPDGWPAWAPSGRRLAIARLGRIWSVATDGTGLRRLTHGPATVSDWDPTWQPR
jgi:Tol biopolymer transport system component